ncbi:uncharacterized protein LOC128964607 [Oppia nitens]|uniref:uncharacterized protein LOC128964607 n=1 Tax=Oppia nitens TaxID=1686743 RepID=UPI0023DA6913|nr:uncharacterized protein LOC128964607 [Oppia nitens]
MAKTDNRKPKIIIINNKIKRRRLNSQIEDNITDQTFSPFFPTVTDVVVPVVGQRLLAKFFANKSCIELSKTLLGQILCRKLSPDGPILRGRIVETEAYLGSEDKACHSYGGRRTARNEPMFMNAGTIYVYFTYGMYYCFNLSAEAEGSAVLLRAVQPVDGSQHMIELRNRFLQRKRPEISSSPTDRPIKPKMLANGPAKLCIAFDINKDNLNKVDITSSNDIWIESAKTVGQEDIVCRKRIGISGDNEWVDKELRFYIKDCEFVSKK